jgi:hypothetical protein
MNKDQSVYKIRHLGNVHDIHCTISSLEWPSTPQAAADQITWLAEAIDEERQYLDRVSVKNMLQGRINRIATAIKKGKI